MQAPAAAVVWGPPFWFFLTTAALTYPQTPTETAKKKYYELFANLPLFIPNARMSARFSQVLDVHPVQPYLVSRDSLVRWVYIVHDRYNAFLGHARPSFDEAMAAYRAQYESADAAVSHMALRAGSPWAGGMDWLRRRLAAAPGWPLSEAARRILGLSLVFSAVAVACVWSIIAARRS